MRFAVENVMGILAAEETPERLLREYPFLEAADIQAWLAYAHRSLSGEQIQRESRSQGVVKFLLDVCVSSRSLESSLNLQGHDVLSAAKFNAMASDAELLEFAATEGRVLITADKDFGELVFCRHLPHGSIVRVVEHTVDQKVAALAELLRDQAEILLSYAQET